MVAQEKYNDRIIASLRSAVNDGQLGLADVPDLVKRVLREKLWCARVIQQTKETVQFEHFMDFVEAPPLEGLGANLKTLQRLCADDSEALDMLDCEMQSERGKRPVRSTIADNVRVNSYPHGNSRQYALRRLRLKRPDLHTKVLAGDLSAHKAMQEAGFRHKIISIPIEPIAAARIIIKHFSDYQLIQFIRTLERIKH